MKVLIAYDGSQCADAALDDMTHAGLPEEGEALVMSVAEVWLPPPPSSREILEGAPAGNSSLTLQPKYLPASQAVKDAEVLAAKAAERIRRSFPNWIVRHEAVWGSPGWELFSRAEEWQADLIVAGSHGRNLLGRFFLGSISQWLLNEARCSVRVARGKLDEPDFPVRLVLALDGSRGSQKALEQVATRNWPAKSEVLVVTVDQPLELTVVGSLAPPLRQSVQSFNKEEHQKLQRFLEAAARKLRSAGLRAMTKVADGDPKKVLVQIAEDWRADCIFVGATGLTDRLGRFLIGSTAAAVAARAHCSVEVVRKRRRKRKTHGNGH